MRKVLFQEIVGIGLLVSVSQPVSAQRVQPNGLDRPTKQVALTAKPLKKTLATGVDSTTYAASGITVDNTGAAVKIYLSNQLLTLHSFPDLALQYGVMVVGNNLAKMVVWNDSTQAIQYVAQTANVPDTVKYFHPVYANLNWEARATDTANGGFSFPWPNGAHVSGSGNFSSSSLALTPTPPETDTAGSAVLTIGEITAVANRYGLTASLVMPMTTADLARYEGLPRDTIETDFNCRQAIIGLLSEIASHGVSLKNISQDTISTYSNQLKPLTGQHQNFTDMANSLYYQIRFGVSQDNLMGASPLMGVWRDSVSNKTNNLNVANRGTDSVKVIPFSNNPTDTSSQPPEFGFSSFSPDMQRCLVSVYRLAVLIDTGWGTYSPGYDIVAVDLNGQITDGPKSSPYNYCITSFIIDAITDSTAKLKKITIVPGSDFTSKVPDTATIVFLPVSKPNPPTAIRQQPSPNRKNLSTTQNTLRNFPIARQKLFDALGRVAPASLFSSEAQRIRNSQILFRKGGGRPFLQLQ
jgi:antitoxin component of RelBE/YafQ-DinJ toxin-antitoxin module